MLVVNEGSTRRPEQCVLDWLRTWNGQYVIVGLAVSGYPIPDGNPSGATRQMDVVVITPRAVAVIEVQEIASEVTGGALSMGADGRWQLSGFDGEPVPRRDGDPFDKVTSNANLLSQIVRRRHPDAHADKLIVVVPPREATITLDIESRKPGGTVVLDSSAGLRAWFLRTANRKLIWTAEQAYELLGELGLSPVVTMEDLVAEGFPSQTRRPQRPASKVLVQAHASSALGAVDLADDGRTSSELSHSSTPYPPWLPTDIDEEPSTDVAHSLPDIGTDTDAHAKVSAPPPEPVERPDALRPPSPRQAPQLSSAFTGQWSSWIESGRSSDEPLSRGDLDRRSRSVQARQRSTEAEAESVSEMQPQTLSTALAQPSATVAAQPVSEEEPLPSSTVAPEPPPRAEPQPMPLVRPDSAPAAEPTHRASAPRLASVVRICVLTVCAKAVKLISGLPQLLATVVVVGVIVGTTWLLISEGMDPTPTVVEPRPGSSIEPTGPPQPPPSEPPSAPCFPFQQQC
ncbi:NERD domain-containing protein [Nocardia sp. CA-129566]|uniref:nuclease-related domain-containing protein n=1 Tax=Nocardia sp. CA-129566 TaxID=3239976 RepID=UPI003D962C0C